MGSRRQSEQSSVGQRSSSELDQYGCSFISFYTNNVMYTGGTYSVPQADPDIINQQDLKWAEHLKTFFLSRAEIKNVHDHVKKDLQNY